MARIAAATRAMPADDRDAHGAARGCGAAGAASIVVQVDPRPGLQVEAAREQSDIPAGTTPPQVGQRRAGARFSAAPTRRRRRGRVLEQRRGVGRAPPRGRGRRRPLVSNGRSNVSRRSPGAVGRSTSRHAAGAMIVEETFAVGRPRGPRLGRPRRRGMPAANLVPHFGHFRRLPAGTSGRFSTTPHWGHWIVWAMASRVHRRTG